MSNEITPIDIDGTQTLFEQYVTNALLPTANPEPPDGGTGYQDTTQVCLIDKGAWVSTNTYKNYDFVTYGSNKFIWIGGSVNPNIEPGIKGWEKCWTLQTVLQHMGVNIHVV